jgi:DNA repair protein RecO (recombination protein O)
MLYTTRGIVIHHLRYSDSSLIARIFTERFGIKSYIFKGVYKPRAKHSPSMFQHLSLVELVAEDKEYGGLQHPRELRIETPYSHLHTDIMKSSVCVFLNEMLHRSLRHEERDEALFGFIRDSLLQFDRSVPALPNFHLWFCLQLTRFLGFFPSPPESYQEHFNLREGVFQESPDPRDEVLDAQSTRVFAELMARDPGELPLIKVTRETRLSLLAQIILYYRHHVEDLGEIHSHRILSEVLS